MLATTGCSIDHAPEAIVRSEQAATFLWVGDTELRIGDTAIPFDMAPAGRDLSIVTHTYPPGAAATVDVFWADPTFESIESVAMQIDAEGAGPFGNNTRWRATVPAASLEGAGDRQLWVRAVTTDGAEAWDSQDGANYSLRPQSYSVGWIGGFGSYRFVNRQYSRADTDFGPDFAMSTGCQNSGASGSSYFERAFLVWAPGLTDRTFSSDSERDAAAAILDVELFTDARANGWTGVPARFVRQQGNDFLYTFQLVSFRPNSNCIEDVADGRYGFKLRASVDGGASWFWRGTDNGPLGGFDLPVNYGRECSYFGDPMQCRPTGDSPTTRQIRQSGLGAVIDFGPVAAGGSSTFSVAIGGFEPAYELSNLRLEGDADQFRVELYDIAEGRYLEPGESFVLDELRRVNVIVVYAPTRSAPVALPHVATVVWDETALRAGPPASPREIRGLYLRGQAP